MNALSDSTSLISPAITLIAIVCGLIIWFFVNRASVRANQQIALLQALLEEQKKQNALLKQLLPAEPSPPEAERDFIRVIPER